MENNVLPNSAITASSTWGSAHEPWRARLNNVPNGHTGSWSAATNQVGEWLQIDLGRETMVTKIATQGRPPTSWSQWVTSYKILFSSDSTNWKEYKENNSVKVIVNSIANANGKGKGKVVTTTIWQFLRSNRWRCSAWLQFSQTFPWGLRKKSGLSS